MKRFEDKVVVVTGSSQGIGQAIAVAFGREGARVMGLARSPQETTARLVRTAGGEFVNLQVDFSKSSQSDLASVVDQIIGRLGRIDVLVNNAGILRRGPAVDCTEADWNAVLQTNLTAPFFLTQAVARWWIQTGRQQATEAARLKFIQIASLLSFQGGILVPAYTASKHGIAGLTKALANEWAAQRINVNAIAPGYIATEINQALRDDPVRNPAIVGRIPEGRWGKPDDIAGGCLFLASADSDYLNGTILNIDGGWLGR